MTRMTRSARGYLIPLMAAVALLAACDEDTVGPGPAEVVTVQVSPPGATLAVGDTIRLLATARADDGTEITGRTVGWASLDGTYAEVAGSGATALVTALNPGSASIAATVDGKVGTTTLTIVAAPPVPAAIELSAGEAWLEVGEEAHVNAVVRTADGGVMSGEGLAWSTADPAVAAVAPSGEPRVARITAQGEGTTVITARLGELWATLTLTVFPASEPASGLQLQVAAITLEEGWSVPLHAAVWKADGAWNSDPVVHWTSSDTAVATVAPAPGGYGIVTARKAGAITLRASSGGQADTARVTVVAPLNVGQVVIAAADVKLWKGQMASYQATVFSPTGATLSGAPVRWSVEDTTVATVTATGAVLSRRAGTTRVTAQSGSVEGTASLTVMEWPADGAMELTLQATVNPAGGRRDVVPVGETTWADSTGVEHQAWLWLRGGTLTRHGRDRYTQRLDLDVVVSGFGGIMRVVERRVLETQGAVGLHLLDPYAFFLFPDGGAPMMEATPLKAGSWVIDQKVGTAPLLSWLWIMEG